MSFTRRLLVVLAAALVPTIDAAEAKKNEQTNEPPRVTMALPFAVAPGTTNKIVVRGLSLTNATEIQFPLAANPPQVEIKSRGKATIPDKGDPKKVGDTQLELELVLAEGTAPGDVGFVIRAPEGTSNTNLLRVVPDKLLFVEREPNAGFRKPNDIVVPQVIRGVIGEASDVDVFRFRGKAGQRLAVETRASLYGSPLDAIVTLHDARGHVLATSDDGAGSEARFEQVLPVEGLFFLNITDAHDRGGMLYGYLLEIREALAR